MIKLDLVNQIVERTGVSKTKAEQAVDTVFNCMKDALKANDRIELRGFGVSAEIPAQVPRLTSRREKPYASSRAKTCSRFRRGGTGHCPIKKATKRCTEMGWPRQARAR